MIPYVTFLKPSAENNQVYPSRAGELYLFLGYSTNPKYYPYLTGEHNTNQLMVKRISNGEICYIVHYCLEPLEGK